MKLRPSLPVKKSTGTVGFGLIEEITCSNVPLSCEYNWSNFLLTAVLETWVNRGNTSAIKDRNHGCSLIWTSCPPCPHKFLTSEVTMTSWFLKSCLFLTTSPLAAVRTNWPELKCWHCLFSLWSFSSWPCDVLADFLLLLKYICSLLSTSYILRGSLYFVVVEEKKTL